MTSAGVTDGVLLKLNASGEYLSAWRMGGIGSEGLVKPIGLIGNTIYAAGRFAATADFPTGDTLTSFGDQDGFLMALDDAPLAASALRAAAPPANFVEESLTEFDVQPLMAETLATGVRRTEIPSAQTALVDQVFSQLDAQQTASLLDGLLDEQQNSRRPWFKRRR